jgi:hypothetical protein
MLNIGIHEARQDTPFHRLWRRGLMAATLLSETSDGSRCVQEKRSERLMRDICLSGGTSRATSRHRLAEIDDETRTRLRRVYPADFPVTVEDWAVSSGITAAEWFMALRQDYPGIRFTASDSILYLIEARRQQAVDVYILEPDGTPIQYIRPPFVVSLVQLENWVYPVNRAIQRQAMRQWRECLGEKLRIPKAWRDSDCGADTALVPPFVLRRLPLVSPEVRQLAGTHFRLRRHSVFTPLAEPVDVIRTMNILNRAYFKQTQLHDAAVAIERSLRLGGIWIVGRTVVENPAQHEATVFRKLPTGWEPLLRIGSGSEMEAIING